MQSCKTHLTVFSLAVATLLGVTGSAVRADYFTWDNSCADNTWHTCCEFWVGEDCYRDNNWTTGTPLCPACPPLPGAADDVNVGMSFVILNGDASVNSFTSSGTFQFNSGSLSVAIDATYDGPVNWLGGGFGNGTHDVNAGLDAMGTEAKYVRYGTVNQHSTTTWTGTGEIWVDYDGVFNNLAGATFDVQNDSTIQHLAFAGTFNNAGTFTKSGGVGTTRVDGGETFNNSGLVDVQVGRLELDGPGTSSGMFNMAAGTTVDFDANTHTLQDGASITGAGFGRVTGSGTVTISELETATAENFEVAAGYLRGLGTLSITDTLNWTGGQMTDAGVTSVEPAAALNISGTAIKVLQNNRTLDNAGAATWTGIGDILTNNGPVFNNLPGATFDVQNDATFDFLANAAFNFNNAGTFTKSAGAGTTRFDAGAVFNNAGLVDMQVGTLRPDGGGTSTGQWQIAADANVDFQAPTYTLDAGTAITGPGFARMPGGSVAIPNTVTATAENFAVTGGTLRGPGTLSVSNTLDWTGGTMTDAGTTSVEPAAALNISGTAIKVLQNNRTLDNAGAATWTGIGDILTNNGPVFNNLPGATFDVQNDATFDFLANAAFNFNNAGTFTKSAGAGTTRFDAGAVFNNSGTVEVQSGTLRFDGGYTQTDGTAILNGGDIGSTTTLDFQGGNLTGSGTIAAGVDSAAEVSPGLSAGAINITGNYVQSGAGVLTVELAGTGPGEFDLLNVTGSATLDGTLSVSFIESFTPSTGDSFEIITCGSRVGEFATVTGWDSCIWTLEVSYGATSVTLSAVVRRGDFNGDGSVDLDDVGTFVDVLCGTNTDPDDVLMADMNCDDTPNGKDVQPFVNAVLGL